MVRTKRGVKNRIALRKAAQSGEFEKCQEIMNRMSKNNVKAEIQKLSLHKAASNGFHRICKLIMDNVENKCPIAKGQLISECLLGVIDFPKNQRKI